MRRLAIIVLVLLAPYAVSQAQNSTVSGTVFQDGTTIPLEGASVGLAARTNNVVLTDSKGHFSFEHVSPGPYILIVRADRYFAPQIPAAFVDSSEGGQQRAETTVTVPLNVNAGQDVNNLVIQLVHGGVISGRVRTSTGTPLQNVKVAALQPRYIEFGDLKAIVKQIVTTNDRGEYRLFDLPPSEFYVEAQSSPFSYYPGAQTPGAASRLTVTSGVEISGSDITVSPVVRKTISGTLNGPLPLPRSPVFSLVPVDMLSPSSSGEIPMSTLDAARVPVNSISVDISNGHFEIRDVASGTFDVIAKFYGNDSPEQRGYYKAVQSILVRDEDISNLNLVFHPNANIVPRATWTTGNPIPFQLRLKPQDRFLLQMLGGGELDGHTVTFDPAFTAKPTAIPAGHYNFQYTSSQSLPQDYYLSDIRTAGKSVFAGNTVTIEENQSDFEVIFNPDGGTINGVVQNANLQQLAQAKVVMTSFSQDGSTLVVNQSVICNAQGRFTFSRVAPGSYRVLALQGFPPGAELNPQYISKYLGRSQSVVVNPNSQNDITLPLISR